MHRGRPAGPSPRQSGAADGPRVPEPSSGILDPPVHFASSQMPALEWRLPAAGLGRDLEQLALCATEIDLFYCALGNEVHVSAFVRFEPRPVGQRCPVGISGLREISPVLLHLLRDRAIALGALHGLAAPDIWKLGGR